MKVKVYHASHPDFGFTRPGDQPPSWPNEFILVAQIDSPRNNVTEALDDAYYLINSIDKPWWENKSVTVIVANTRSTSVGDVIVVDDVPYKSVMVGFEKIPAKETKA